MQTKRITYNDQISRQFVAASVIWGIVGMLVGVIIAVQLAFWQANIPPFLIFSRLRPLHTNAVIFAFVGNMIFAGVYYSTQRLVKARLASDLLAKIHFWGWQLIIVSAALTLPFGISQSKEYAELEWPIDIAIALIWVVFAVNFFWTLARRNEKHLYVALWFYIATLIAIAVLHIVNSLAIPVGFLESYPVFAGVQDALVQWWYGHNAVAFFLTTPILGIMYYFLPKAADRPVFSYRLSIVHFWSLVFIYILPSWGGMLNGLLTLRGAWDRLREDPVLKLFAAGVTFYGMSTFEGPLLSIKSVSGLAHYTDWIIAHVHAGGLGWNGFMAAGMFYWMVPRLYGTKLHSRSAANAHFYLGTFGIVLYVASMWIAGITQGLMWRAENDGGGLMYPNFLETLIELKPLYWTRALGGTLYLLGFILMAWNLVMTAKSGKAVDGETEAVIEDFSSEDAVPWHKLAFAKPITLILAVTVMVVAVAFLNAIAATVIMVIAISTAIVGGLALGLGKQEPGQTAWHRILEGRAVLFTVFVTISVIAGGIAELVPTIMAAPEAIASAKQTPYSALELEGRDIYVNEGCYVCHSQMIRPFTWETARYGDVSTADDSVFDHPFQWGSRRIGPDLARVGGKYSNLWHYRHMIDPREISQQSNMPPYPFLETTSVDFSKTASKFRAMRAVGVPYTPEQIANAEESARMQAAQIAADLKNEGQSSVKEDSKLVALIAYLQRLGFKATQTKQEQPQAVLRPTEQSAAGTTQNEVVHD
ncbi:MAG: cytochrome-c oxidase, cbb3-type subunit II [Myxococcales bacterium]|nr:MAG: cytochrome-c oxidase, cbb3-type subunit II [Myxococcales bacterium]